MPLEALLTFIGIIVAALAIMRPVQRYSLFLFVPAGLILGPVALALSLIAIRDMPLGVKPPVGIPLDMAVYLLTIGSFIVPVASAIWGGVLWYRAKLTPRNAGGVQHVLEAALRENEFDEVERIVSRNQSDLSLLPTDSISVLFSPKMVESFLKANSLIHIQLLADVEFLDKLGNRLGAVDVVTRKLLASDLSPLRSAIVKRYGGIEYADYPQRERNIMERTFERPEWYKQTNAHYPLLMAAQDRLATGQVDGDYNAASSQYHSNQGFSGRAYCPIYLAEKTQVLAIKAAIKESYKADLYVTDLFDLFRHILDRSHYVKNVWESRLGYWEFPTPFSYLLYQIANDLRDMAEEGLAKATKSGTSALDVPGIVIEQIARAWSMSVWLIADSDGKVSPDFRRSIVERYLTFVLSVGQ